jgi:hypothetical protein
MTAKVVEYLKALRRERSKLARLKPTHAHQSYYIIKVYARIEMFKLERETLEKKRLIGCLFHEPERASLTEP